MSVPVAVPSVGTLIPALAGSELSYDHLYKQACWLFERVKGSASFLLRGISAYLCMPKINHRRTAR